MATAGSAETSESPDFVVTAVAVGCMSPEATGHAADRDRPLAVLERHRSAALPRHRARRGRPRTGSSKVPPCPGALTWSSGAAGRRRMRRRRAGAAGRISAEGCPHRHRGQHQGGEHRERHPAAMTACHDPLLPGRAAARKPHWPPALEDAALSWSPPSDRTNRKPRQGRKSPSGDPIGGGCSPGDQGTSDLWTRPCAASRRRPVIKGHRTYRRAPGRVIGWSRNCSPRGGTR